MAGQAGLPAVVELLNETLAEERVTDSLLSQIARQLMSEARADLNGRLLVIQRIRLHERLTSEERQPPQCRSSDRRCVGCSA
jgi:hypothetical protein